MSTSRNRKYRYAAPIGGLFIVLAIIGVIAIVVASINFTQKLLDNTKEKKMFEEMLRPVIMFDPVPFNSPAEADQNMVLQAAMWSTLMDEKSGSYAYDDTMRLIVPSTDVEASAAKLFGKEVTLNHMTFGDYEMTYEYEADTKTYHVPIMGRTSGFYIPKVVEIKKKGDVLQLMVGYIPPGNSWTTTIGGETEEPQAEKYMYYEMKKSNKDYYLYAIKDIPAEENPIISQAAQSAASQS